MRDEVMDEASSNASSGCSLRLFLDVLLGLLGSPGDKGRIGAVWHWTTGTVSWLDFSGMSSETTDRILYVLAVLAPLSSPAWGVHMSYQLGNGEEFNPAGVLSPWLVWGIPVVAGFVGWVLVEVASIRGCRRNGVPVDPPPREKSRYVHDVLEHNYRHNDADGTVYRFQTPYLTSLFVLVALALLTVLLVWTLSVPETVGWFAAMEIILALLVFSDCLVVLSVVPYWLVLLRLERLYGRYVEAWRGGLPAGGGSGGCRYLGVVPVGLGGWAGGAGLPRFMLARTVRRCVRPTGGVPGRAPATAVQSEVNGCLGCVFGVRDMPHAKAPGGGGD